ncbi:MAG: SDR family oxidoreductase [Sphingobacteriia bacterium]|nr:SDR family oxidoreductase [Sphingobacteriia bacterium]
MRIILQFLFCIILVTSAYADNKKTIVITLATSGIGQSVAEELAKQNYDLILLGRNSQKLNDLKNHLGKNYKGNYQNIQIDFGNSESVNNALKQINKKIDGIVLMPPRSVISSYYIPNSNEWDYMFKISFSNPFEVIRQLEESLKPGAKIVLMSGMTSVQYNSSYPNSNILRSMWVAQGKNLSFQLARKNVSVNTISPGVTLTETNKSKVEARAKEKKISYDQQLKNETKAIPSGRYSTPQEIAKIITFLLSDDSNQINGQNLVIDGGFTTSY